MLGSAHKSLAQAIADEEAGSRIVYGSVLLHGGALLRTWTYEGDCLTVQVTHTVYPQESQHATQPYQVSAYLVDPQASAGEGLSLCLIEGTEIGRPQDNPRLIIGQVAALLSRIAHRVEEDTDYMRLLSGTLSASAMDGDRRADAYCDPLAALARAHARKRIQEDTE